MAKTKVSPQFRTKLSEKLMDLGNLVAVSLAIGQFISGQTFSMALFVSGIGVLLLCYLVSYAIIT